MTDTITLVFRNRDKIREVEAHTVAPGLAAHPASESGDYQRFTLTHIGSKKSLISTRCAAHIAQAAQIARESGIDWTLTDDQFDVDRIRAVAEAVKEKTGWFCSRRCDNIGPSWKVMCRTCGWDAADDNDDPMDFRDAQDEAREHTCDPQVLMCAPDSRTWAEDWRYSADGSLPKREAAEKPKAEFL